MPEIPRIEHVLKKSCYYANLVPQNVDIGYYCGFSRVFRSISELGYGLCFGKSDLLREYLFACMDDRPQESIAMPARKLLVLDLDETLIHGNPEAVGGDFHAAGIPVFVRPGAILFLKQMTAVFDLAVWTSASADYANDIVKTLFPSPPMFLWCRERCVRWFNPEKCETEYVKDLKKLRRLGWDLAHVLVVDDSPEKLVRNYGNLVRVPPFVGGQDDILRPLAAFLIELSVKPDVRRIEKRGWLATYRTRDFRRSIEPTFLSNW